MLTEGAVAYINLLIFPVLRYVAAVVVFRYVLTSVVFRYVATAVVFRYVATTAVRIPFISCLMYDWMFLCILMCVVYL